MKKGLLLVFAIGTLISTIIYSVQTGYGTALSILPEVLGWKLVAAVFSSQYADTHTHFVAIVGGVLNSALLTMLLGALLLVARKRGRLLSTSSVVKTLVIGTLLYLALMFLAFPLTKGF